jgi:hypothetical protein
MKAIRISPDTLAALDGETDLHVIISALSACNDRIEALDEDENGGSIVYDLPTFEQTGMENFSEYEDLICQAEKLINEMGGKSNNPNNDPKTEIELVVFAPPLDSYTDLDVSSDQINWIAVERAAEKAAENYDSYPIITAFMSVKNSTTHCVQVALEKSITALDKYKEDNDRGFEHLCEIMHRAGQSAQEELERQIRTLEANYA